jgi:hypothetical protein
LGGTTNDAGTNDTSMTSTRADYSLGVTGTGAGLVAILEYSATTLEALSGAAGGTRAAVSTLSSGGCGVSATGLLAPLFHSLGPAAGAPTTGTHALGEIFVGLNGGIYRAVAAGTPGVWAPLNRLCPWPPRCG